MPSAAISSASLRSAERRREVAMHAHGRTRAVAIARAEGLQRAGGAAPQHMVEHDRAARAGGGQGQRLHLWIVDAPDRIAVGEVAQGAGGMAQHEAFAVERGRIVKAAAIADGDGDGGVIAVVPGVAAGRRKHVGHRFLCCALQVFERCADVPEFDG
jgi:hypothetical protein